MRPSHTEARALCIVAFEKVFGRAPSRSEAQLCQAIGFIETGYGSGWKPPGRGSNNMGAVQKGSWNGKTFGYQDSRPNDDGTSTKYYIEFRWYDTPLDGWVDLVKRVYTGGLFSGKVGPYRQTMVLAPASAGDSKAFSEGLYDTSYYQGFGKNREERVRNHHKQVIAAVRAQAKELKEPLAAFEQEYTGEELDALESALGIVTVEYRADYDPSLKFRDT